MPIVKERAILVVHYVENLRKTNSKVKQIHEVELNNTFLSQFPKQHKAYQVFGSNIYYYKIENDLENNLVVYKLYRFSFATRVEELVQEHME